MLQLLWTISHKSKFIVLIRIGILQANKLDLHQLMIFGYFDDKFLDFELMINQCTFKSNVLDKQNYHLLHIPLHDLENAMEVCIHFHPLLTKVLDEIIQFLFITNHDQLERSLIFVTTNLGESMT